MAIGTTNYPGSLDTATELIRTVNDAATTIAAGGATSSATTINVTSASSAPADGIAVIVSATDETVREIISYTGKTSTTLTGCIRNLESSGAKTWAAGDLVFFDILTSLSRTVLVNALIALQTKLGISADTPTSGDVLKGTGTGASAWSPLTPSDISGLGFTPASSAGPASLAFPEDTDNGTSKITVVAPASLSADYTQTLPAATGTVALVPTVTQRTDSTTVTNGSTKSVAATCNAGEVLTGGGCDIDTAASTAPMLRGRADTAGYTCTYANNSGATRTITAKAICMLFST